MRRKLVLSLVVLVSLAVSAQAAEPFVVLVDEERGLLLIPEGTAIPKGVEFRVTRDTGALTADAAAEEGTPRRLVYAYAAPEKFVEARRRIAEVEANTPDRLAGKVAGERRTAGPVGVPRPGRIAANVDELDETYYYYFWDNSYHAVRKRIRNSSNGPDYTLYGYVYAAAGDWDTKVYVNNTCPDSQYWFWNRSETCWFYNSDGDCTPAVWSIWTSQTVTATVTSQATLTRYLYPPCNLPCKSNSSSTASVSFP